MEEEKDVVSRGSPAGEGQHVVFTDGLEWESTWHARLASAKRSADYVGPPHLKRSAAGR